jgi:hypothetical protein
MPAITRSFSAADGKKAGLLGKQNWSKYGDRMLWNRAVSYALNDAFADLLGGLYDPSELGGPVIDDAGQVLTPPVEVEPAPPRPKPAPKPPLEVAVPGGWDPVTFERSKKGLREALVFMGDAIIEGGAAVVTMNAELLDTIAEKLPELAEQVAELRAAADEALLSGDDAGEAEAEDDVFPGDLPSRVEG